MFLAYKANHNGRFLVLGIVLEDLPEVVPGTPKYGELIPFGFDVAQKGQIPLVDFIVPLCAANEADLMEMLPDVLREIEAGIEDGIPAPRTPGDHDQEERSNGQLHDLASAAARIRDLERQLETEREFGQMILSGGSLSNMTAADLPDDEPKS